MIINTGDIEQARKFIKQAREKNERPVIVQAHDDNFNRKILEYGKFDILLSIEAGNRKDNLKQLDSGLNHVLAKIAAKNNVSIGIDIEEIKKLSKKEKAIRLARIKQNIKLCRKAKAKIKVLNSPTSQQTFSFLISLGASTEQAKEAIP